MSKVIKQLPVMQRVIDLALAPVVRADGEPDDGIQRYDVVFSTETPVSRGGFWDDPWLEILGHDKGEVRLDRMASKGPVMLEHYNHIGAADAASIDTKSKVGRARIFFSENQLGQDVERDVKRGIKNKMSVRYKVHEMVLVKKGDREKGGVDEYRVTDWEPVEISVVAIPADPNAVIGRNKAEEGKTYPVTIDDGAAVTEESRAMDENENKTKGGAAAAEAEPQRGASGSPAPAVVEITKTEREQEMEEISAMCRNSKVPVGLTLQILGSGMSKARAGDFIADIIKTTGPIQPAAERKNAIPDGELKNYSLSRAILMTMPKGEGGIDWGGFEAECHQELERSLPANIKRQGGILVPTNMPGPDPVRAARAAKELGRAYPLDSATSTEGTEFKFTGAGPFIEMLRNRLVTTRLGARFFPGLNQPMGFPRQTGASTPTWQSAEGAAISDSMAAFELMTLTPKTLIDTTGTTRQLLRLGSEDMEALLRDDILKSHKVAIDTAAFVGTGASGQPSGLYVISGIQSYDIGPGANANAVPDYVDITSMIGLLGDAAADEGDPKFALTTLLAATLMRTLTFPSANTGAPIFQGRTKDGTLAGYPAIASNVLSKTLLDGVPTGGAEHGIVFGDFSELFIGEWGAFEIIADPYSSKKSGIVELTSFQMVDVNVRHQKSFVKGINAIP